MNYWGQIETVVVVEIRMKPGVEVEEPTIRKSVDGEPGEVAGSVVIVGSDHHRVRRER